MIKIFNGLFIASLVGAVVQMVKEACEPTIPAENWANKELYYKELMDGVSAEQRIKNVKSGKYKLIETYPEPHRTADGKILIENYKLYNEDLKKYGAQQTYKWVSQGKYNLTPEKLEEERKRIRKEYEYLYN